MVRMLAKCVSQSTVPDLSRFSSCTVAKNENEFMLESKRGIASNLRMLIHDSQLMTHYTFSHTKRNQKRAFCCAMNTMHGSNSSETILSGAKEEKGTAESSEEALYVDSPEASTSVFTKSVGEKSSAQKCGENPWPESIPVHSVCGWCCRLWNNWSFSYMKKLLKKGNLQYKNGEHLTQEDLFDVPADMCADHLVEKFW